MEKYESSRRLLEKHGMGGLRVTRLNEYRDKPKEEASKEIFIFRQFSSKKSRRKLWLHKSTKKIGTAGAPYLKIIKFYFDFNIFTADLLELLFYKFLRWAIFAAF